LKVGFEVIRGKITEGGMSALMVVIRQIMADFQLGFAQVAEAVTVE